MVKKIKILVLIVAFSVGITMNGFVYTAETARADSAEGVPEVVVEGETIESGSPDTVRTNERKPMLKARALDYLEGLPGVDLYRQSYSGARSSMLRLRGFDESRLLIMLNNTPLNGSGVYGGYYVDWESLTIDDVESIEVIRGGHSARYGDTLGGVIIVNSVKRTGKLDNMALASISSFDTQNYQLSHSWGLGPAYWTVSGSYYDTDGYLRNNSSQRQNYNVDLTFKLTPKTWLGLHAKFTDTTTGFIVGNDSASPYYNAAYPRSLEDPLGGPYVPFRGGNFYWGDGSNWRDQRQLYSLDFEHDFDSLILKFNFAWNQQERWEYFYAVDDPNHLVLERYTQPEENTWSVWVGVEKHKIGKHSLDYGFEARNYGYGSEDYREVDPNYFWFSPTSATGRFNVQRTYSAYIQDRWQALDWLRFEPGLRYDNYSSDDEDGNLNLNHWSPKLSTIIKPWQNGEIAVRTSKAYRFPTCPELYWYVSGYQPSDRGSIKPEDAMLYDLELSQKFPDTFGTKLSLRGYYYQIDDYIRTIFGYRPSRVVYNIDRVNLGGVEFSSSMLFKWGGSIFASYTYQDSRKEGDILDYSTALTNRLPELPRNKANLALGYYFRDDALIRLRLNWIDERGQIVGNLSSPGSSSLKPLDPVTLVSIDAGYPIFKKDAKLQGTIIGSVENLTNADYQEIWGYPMPGRTFSLGVKLDF